MKTKSMKGLPRVVSVAKWQVARDNLLIKEKAHMRAGDKLAARRRRLPMVHIEKKYVFEGLGGKKSLLDLFDGRRQLVLYHFMFAPDVPGWPDTACPGCSMMVDQYGHLAHLHARNTSLVLVSIAPLANIKRFQKRMGWQIPWYSSAGTEFNADFGRTTADGEMFGLSIFLRDGNKVFRTYFADQRGVEPFGSVWSFLDASPLGRQETWEDTPPGRTKQTPPFMWWRRHNEYSKKK